MEKKKLKKHKQYSIDEKNQMVMLYFDHHLSRYEIIRKYEISSESVFRRWLTQYTEFGTCVDRRGKATKIEAPNKGRPKKYTRKLEELNKDQLIEKVRMYQDIKKYLVYLMNQASNNTIK